MSSSYNAHYTTPSSLPSDYAAISRYAAATAPHPSNSEQVDNSDCSDSDSTVEHDRNSVDRKRARPSKPLKQGIPSRPSAVTSENTPLLSPPAPRIEEYVDSEDSEHVSIRLQYWEECKVIVRYTLPVLGTHMLEYSLVISSVVSIGHLSTAALAAATLGSMTASVTGYSIIQGFVSTLDTMLPSAWTSSQPHLVGLWCQRISVVLAAILIPIGAIWLNAEAILLLVRQDPEVARLAGLYLRWSLLGLPAYAFNQVARRYFQSQGLLDVPTRVLLVVAPVNAFLNYFLVWGPAWIRFGFVGAPLAAAFSLNLSALLSILYGILFAPRTAWRRVSRRAFTNLGILVQLGLAGVGQTASEWWSWELVGLAASLLGPVALATQSVLLVSSSTAYQAPYSLSIASSVRIGNLLGEANARRAGIAANVSLLVALIFAGFNSTVFLVFRKSWGYLFNDDPEVVSLVASILPLVALFQIGDCLDACTGGILRAQGKQFTGALLNLSAYYVLGLPLGLWLAFAREWRLAGLWTGLSVALIYAAIVSVWICLRTDWQQQVHKVQARVEKDRVDDMHARSGGVGASAVA
ncbi:hypothetical protein EW145_g1918 [Phellinidium pouzarii]|uniref:MATE efflux family protein n=1 Tax=Phellinidium pouzarii TaxID=167371 RepID=A0A4S4LEG6_9AGAM|nr:hypothetical protein EW145_g1918 [Phellinidium pouzarii]